MSIQLKTYGPADFCLRTSLYFVGRALQNRLDYDTVFMFNQMVEICRLDKFFGHRKSAEYTWRDSDGLTKFLYDKFLKKRNINPYKGLNADQYRAFFIYLYMFNDWKKALKIIIGFIFRLGFTPSLMEWAPLKPQAYVLLLNVKFPYYLNYLWRPLFWFCLACFKISARNEIKNVPIEESTTNKLSMLPTMFVLKMQMPSNIYILKTYLEYWKPLSEGYFIGEAISQGLLDRGVDEKFRVD